LIGDVASGFFLLRFLLSNDECEQQPQINYPGLTFAFTGTLVFSEAIGFVPSCSRYPEREQLRSGK